MEHPEVHTSAASLLGEVYLFRVRANNVESETKASFDKRQNYVYNIRLHEDSTQTLKDLALIVQELPEEQIALIFGVEEISRLIKVLLSRARRAYIIFDSQER